MAEYNEKSVVEVGLMKNELVKIINSILMFFSLTIFCVGLITQDFLVIFWAILFAWIAGVLFSIEHIRERIIVLCFMVTVLTFLLAGSFLELIVKHNIETIFSNDVNLHIAICLYIAIIGFILGCLLGKKIVSSFKIKYSRRNSKVDKNKCFQKASKILAYFTFIFYLLDLIEKIVFVRGNTYIEYYLSYSSNLPGIIIKLADIFPVAFWIFMGSMPSKKEVNRAMILYGGYAVLSLGSGQRNKFVLGILMIIIYYFFRDKLDHNQRWINKKICVIGIICVPFLISFLYFFGISRDGNVATASTGEAIVEFMKGQSESVNLIGYEKVYESSLDEDKIYSLGRLKDFFENNIIAKVFLDIPVYGQQTPEAAIYGNSFGQLISYLVMPWNYVKGIGLGSCYIAELYHDFGYLGIFLFDFLLGILLVNSLYIVKKENLFVVGIFLLMVDKIIYMPRDTTSNFLYTGINFTTILTIVLIVIIGKMIQMKYKGR